MWVTNLKTRWHGGMGMTPHPQTFVVDALSVAIVLRILNKTILVDLVL
jgi:hypothetical protein